MADRWEIGQVDELFQKTLANDAVIKTKMGITGAGEARVSAYRVVRDADFFPYIYFYCITGPDTKGQGRVRIQTNVEYVFEVRAIGAPTDDTEAIVDRVDTLIGEMTKQLTPDNKWVVSAVRKSPVVLSDSGETNEIYYSRRGGTYDVYVVRA